MQIYLRLYRNCLSSAFGVVALLTVSSVASVSLLLASGTAHAQTWIGQTSEDWNTGLNWSTGETPGAGTAVYINTIAPNPTVADQVVLLTDNMLNIGKLNIGTVAGSTGELTLLNGSQFQVDGVDIGTEAAANGTLNIIDSQMWSTSKVDIGSFGQGSMLVQGGSALLALSDDNLILVGGFADGWGSLTVAGGAQISAKHLIVGNGRGSGKLIIDDAQINLLQDLTVVGQTGDTSVEVKNGGTVTLGRNFDLGGFGTSTGYLTITGVGSKIESEAVASLGWDGKGRAVISDNGALMAHDIAIGYYAAGDGDVLVASGGKIEAIDVLAVGYGGKGVLTLSEGGKASAESVLIAALTTTAPSSGSLNIGAREGEVPASPGTLTAANVVFGAGDGRIVFNHTDTSGNYVFSPVILGNGTVDVLSGKTVITGASTYAGPTTISGGILTAGGAGVFSPNSDYIVKAHGTLNLNGFNQTISSLNNVGLVNIGAGTSPGTVLTMTNYIGLGGTLAMNTFLGADDSLSDRLVIDGGTTSGNSFLYFTNTGGPGAQTTANGILVVEAINGGTTTANTFSMVNGELRAGAFDYRLFQGGLDGSDPDNWYLRSTFIADGGPDGPTTMPITGPELATYGVVQPIAQQLGRVSLGTHDERMGQLYHSSCELVTAPVNASVYTKISGDCGTDDLRPAVWGRLFGQEIDNRYHAFADPRASGHIAGFQAGIDLLRSDSVIAGHRDYAGLYVAYGNDNVDVSGLVTNTEATAYVQQRTGSLNLDAWTGGVYWTHYGATGWYLDLVLQGTSYGGTARTEFAQLNTSGTGFISSLEGGYPISLPQFGPGFVLEPQAQMLWSRVRFKSGNDGLGPVALGTTSMTTARLGLKGRWLVTTESGQLWQPYVRANFWRDFGGGATTLFDTDAVSLTSRGQYMDINVGFSTRINTYFSVYADAGYQFAVGSSDRRNGVKGTAGLRYQW